MGSGGCLHDGPRIWLKSRVCVSEGQAGRSLGRSRVTSGNQAPYYSVSSFSPGTHPMDAPSHNWTIGIQRALLRAEIKHIINDTDAPNGAVNGLRPFLGAVRGERC